ncbi:MAG TPA: septation protein SepH, partial [Mycobacteriales bacterium]|nr:septation protein SepH [Mycobacteriales bacterium]
MRELHVVAISEDGRHVVLAPTKSGKGSHRVRLDARLVSAVKGELGASDANDLSPKEIQARLRAGESAEQIARTAGVAVTRVERFAGPVAGERMRMIEQAREAFVVRGRLGRSAQPMGKVVDATLDDHAKPDSTAWTARREDDGRWCVQVTWDARGKSRSASWRYDPHDRSLEAADPASAALGHVGDDTGTRRTARKHVSAEPAASAPARQSSPRPAAKAAPAKKAAARTAPVKKA